MTRVRAPTGPAGPSAGRSGTNASRAARRSPISRAVRTSGGALHQLRRDLGHLRDALADDARRCRLGASGSIDAVALQLARNIQPSRIDVSQGDVLDAAVRRREGGRCSSRPGAEPTRSARRRAASRVSSVLDRTATASARKDARFLRPALVGDFAKRVDYMRHVARRHRAGRCRARSTSCTSPVSRMRKPTTASAGSPLAIARRLGSWSIGIGWPSTSKMSKRSSTVSEAVQQLFGRVEAGQSRGGIVGEVSGAPDRGP